MKKLLGLFIIVLVLLPCLGLAYLWWRSISQTDDITASDPGRMTRFRSSGGGFWFETRSWDANTPAKLDWQVYANRAQYPFAASPDDPWYQRLGVLVNITDYDLLLAAPYWLVLALHVPLPSWMITRSWRREQDSPRPSTRRVSAARSQLMQEIRLCSIPI